MASPAQRVASAFFQLIPACQALLCRFRREVIASQEDHVSTTPQAPLLSLCCKDLATALSFPAGRHLFVEDGKLQLLVARTPLQGGGEADLQNAVRFCPFCGTPTADLALKA